MEATTQDALSVSSVSPLESNSPGNVVVSSHSATPFAAASPTTPGSATGWPSKHVNPEAAANAPDYSNRHHTPPLASTSPLLFHLSDLPSGSLDLSHMSLLIHLSSPAGRGMFSLGDDVPGPYATKINLILQRALRHPYLLHQLLAFSARHLAHLLSEEEKNRDESWNGRDEEVKEHMHLAVALQTRAVEMFNTEWKRSASAAAGDGGESVEVAGGVVDESNCFAVLLFATVLGHHVLADTLLARAGTGDVLSTYNGGDVSEDGPSHALDAFLARYMSCAEMHRGIHTVAVTAWPMLMRTELQETLFFSASFTSRAPFGHDCEALYALVDGAEGLTDVEREACRTAAGQLQVGFDAVLHGEHHLEAEERGEGEQVIGDETSQQGFRYKYQMIFLWTVVAPPKFMSLLAARRPEALVVFGYYALLLHHGRSLWQVGDAGRFVLRMLLDYLGPLWHRWLAFPRERMTQDFGGEW